MKHHNVKKVAGVMLIALCVLSGCAGKDEMGMTEMKKDSMESEMTHDTEMKKMDGDMTESMKPQMGTMKKMQ